MIAHMVCRWGINLCRVMYATLFQQAAYSVMCVTRYEGYVFRSPHLPDIYTGYIQYSAPINQKLFVYVKYRYHRLHYLV